MVAILSRLTRAPRREVTVECRRYGTTIEGSPPACPTCGGSGFAEYRVAG